MHNLFFFFNPQFEFLAWQSLLTDLWIVTMIAALILVFIYYLGFSYDVTKNKRVYFWTGMIGAFVISVGCLLYMLIEKPIADIKFFQTLNVAVHLLFWAFIGYFILSLLRFAFAGFKHPNNGFLHKKNVPF